MSAAANGQRQRRETAGCCRMIIASLLISCQRNSLPTQAIAYQALITSSSMTPFYFSEKYSELPGRQRDVIWITCCQDYYYAYNHVPLKYELTVYEFMWVFQGLNIHAIDSFAIEHYQGRQKNVTGISNHILHPYTPPSDLHEPAASSTHPTIGYCHRYLL